MTGAVGHIQSMKNEGAFAKAPSFYMKIASGVCKPSSVLDDHLSRPQVAMGLKRLPESVTGRHMCFPINLAPDGVYRADKSPCRW